jgi:deazaflavin-dependent oxidoreductase (nitroreductase family)
MNDAIRQALTTDRTIDITTIGRRSGQPRRIETWFHNLDNRLYLTGRPGQRDWYANLVAQPAFTFHLKEGVVADLAARARPITEPAERRAVLSRLLVRLDQATALEEWVAESPLIEVTLDRG